MSTVRRVTKNIFSLFSASVICHLIAFLITVYIARKFGVVTFGILAFAMAFVGYFGILTDLGIGTLAVREVARDKKLSQEFGGNIIVLRLLFSVAAFLILLLATKLLQFPFLKSWLIVLYGLAFFVSALHTTWIYSAHERMEYRALLETLSSIIYAAAVFLILSRYFSILAIPIANLLAGFLTALVGFYLFWKFFGRIKLKINFNYWKSFVISALAVGISAMMIRIYYNFDTIMLSFMKGDAAVGWYNAAYRIILVLIELGTFYFTAIFPILSSRYKTSLESLQSILQKSVKLTVAVGLPLGIGGTILARPMMDLIFGVQYTKGILAFQILIWAVVIGYVSMIYANSLLACDRQKQLLKIVTIGAFINLGANFILIPRFSIYGAAAATVFTEIVIFSLAYLELRKIVKVSFANYLLKPLLASLIMGIMLFFLRSLNFILLFFAGLFVYLIFLFLFKAVTREDIDLVKGIFLREGR